MGYDIGAFLLNILTASNEMPPWGFGGCVCPNNALFVGVVPTVRTNGLLYPANNPPPVNGFVYYFFSYFF